MSRIEEKNNEDKEEVLIFGTEEGDEIRMLLNMRKGRLTTKEKDRRKCLVQASIKTLKDVKRVI